MNTLTEKLEALIDEGLTVEDALQVFHDQQSNREQGFIKEARGYVEAEEGLEIDEHPLVRPGDSPDGAFVSVWLWVEAPRIQEWRDAVAEGATTKGYDDWFAIAEPEEGDDE